MLTVRVRRDWVVRNSSAMQFLEMIYPLGCWSQRVPADWSYIVMLCLLLPPDVWVKVLQSIRGAPCS